MDNQVLFAGYHIARFKKIDIKGNIDGEGKIVHMIFKEENTDKKLHFYSRWPVLESKSAMIQFMALGVDITKSKFAFLKEFSQMEGFKFILNIKVVEYNSTYETAYRNEVNFVLPYNEALADRLLS